MVGGNPANKHAKKHAASSADRWGTKKTTVLSVIDKATGEARSAVAPNLRAHTLRTAMEDELLVNLGATTLHTDAARHYVRIAATTKGHESVNHDAGEYVRGGVSTNAAEGYFAQLNVARALAKLGDGWRVLHAVPVGNRNSDIDHVVIGPGGVFTINAKNHPGAKVWAGGDVVKITASVSPMYATAHTKPSAQTRCSRMRSAATSTCAASSPLSARRVSW